MSDGKYDTTTGSQAFHIAVVSAITPGSRDALHLEIAESSGATAASGGNGVNVRNLGQVTATVAKGFVSCMDGKNRIYFTGQQGSAQPYMPNAWKLLIRQLPRLFHCYRKPPLRKLPEPAQKYPNP